MSYMETVFEDAVERIAEQTGLAVRTVEDAWLDLCESGLADDFDHFQDMAELAKETGYPFLELVAIYIQARTEAEEDDVPFDWEQFCGVTRDRDW